MGILKIRQRIALCLVFLLFFSSIATRTSSQILPRLSNPLNSLGQSVGRMSLAGDIEYTPVYLDGVALFRIGSQDTVSADSDTSGLSPVERRARRVERAFQNILNNGFDPNTLSVTTATLNNQTVIVASDGKTLPQQVILTVTEIDALLDASSPEELARQWSEIIRRALIEAWRERQPEARQRQFLTVAIVLAGMIFLSWWLYWCHKFLKKNFNELKQQISRQSSEVSSPSALTHPAISEPLEGSQTFRQQADLRQKLSLNILWKRLVQIGVILLWIGGVAAILYIFPETRLEGRDVFRIPLRLFAIWLVVLLLANAINLYVNYRMREWVEEGVIFSENSQRRVLRAPTLLDIWRGIIVSVAVCIGIAWFLIWTGFSFGSFLTGAGLVGAVLTFVFQSLLKDWVNGFLIVLEDQYAVGDMIQFEGFIGIVEEMSLRATRLRALDGRSITIPHNQIVSAHNLSRDWSRVHFTIEVAYETDPDVAIELMKATALEMAIDPRWTKDIIDPTQIIGVSKVSNVGIEIMLLIVVQRLRQWDVDREYRRRLKLAFDAKGIQIGIPQQSLYLAENYDLDRLN
ncbi:mechanosensitive ion channel family protein [Pannus brasiliensis CCIBt3594]|uniref:Mechanosensitive ion channel family protein n=1 Tax=Pannus brasiliensis CCIBt3594 TaxID=1427578 RepID=A0AAW9QXS4_9CHRO